MDSRPEGGFSVRRWISIRHACPPRPLILARRNVAYDQRTPTARREVLVVRDARRLAAPCVQEYGDGALPGDEDKVEVGVLVEVSARRRSRFRSSNR